MPPCAPSLGAMALTSAVANAAAAAAAAGAGKKAAQVQLQAELSTDDEWSKFVGKDGLLVIDVYTEWCGPCIGMVGNLKKIKVELGGDNLHLAVAKADTITCLSRFRNRSEPTWMFLAGGQLLNVVFGANAPLITRTIEQELANELRVRSGELQRPQRAPHELTPQEQEIANAEEKLAKERKEREEAAVAAARLARREARAKRLETHFNDICPGLVLPHAQKNLRKVTDALEAYGLVLADKCPMVLSKDGLKVLAMEEPELGGEATVAALVERPALALMLKRLPDKEGDIIKLSRLALFGDVIEELELDPPKKIAAEELKLNDVPGIYVPKNRHQRAAILDLLFPKMVCALVPPPAVPDPPHVALVFGAWQRRAVLAAAAGLLKYGFFADEDLLQPRLLCKTVDQYEARAEKEYCETIVLAVAVGVAELALVEPNEPIPDGPPEGLLKLGPLHVSEDAVKGEEECARFFPPGYTEPEPKPKSKAKKKKKKRHETKEEPSESSCDAGAGDAEDVGDGADDGDGAGDEPRADSDEAGDGGGDDDVPRADKATSPLPAAVA